MNTTIIKFFVLLLLFVVFLNGCSNVVEEKIVSSLPEKQDIKDITANPEKNNPKMINDVQVLFSPADSQVVLHEPVIVSLGIRNNLEQSISVDLGENRKAGFLFTIVFPDGREVKLPQLKSNGISSKGDFSIKPKHTYSQNLLLNQWVDFASPGKYLLRGQLANAVKTGTEEVVTTDFSTIINIESRNLNRLEEISDTLAQRIIESNNFEQNSETALALSYINDPITVPYLQKVLISGKMVEHIIVNGLIRIGNKESVQVLIDVVNKDPKSELALLSKSALIRLENQSSDPVVKQLIKRSFIR